ncbi:MAG: NHLP bacteriocin export ABC transporter permease/ATPase subunit [bacterium]
MSTSSSPFTPITGPFSTLAVRDGTDGNRPFLLNGEMAWHVRTGYVDIFAVQVEAGEPVGRLAHLMRVNPDECFFGLGAARAGRAFALMAVPTGATELGQSTRQGLSSYAATANGIAELVKIIDGWVDALYPSIARSVPPQRCAEWDAGTEVSFEPTASARPRSSVIWATHLEGHSKLFGRKALILNGVGITPLSRQAWVESEVAGRVVTSTTEEAIRSGELWSGLDRLHGLVLTDVAESAEQTAEAERTRAARRAVAHRRVLTTSCLDLSEVLQSPAERAAYKRASVATTREARSGSDLFAAVRIVAGDLGLTVTLPLENSGAPPARDPLASIARASRFRTRRVALRDDWWNHDNGALLAYRTADKQPVALLRRGGRRPAYELHDPRTGLVEEVTAALAETLGPVAETLYRPFPDTRLEVFDVLKFGARGCGRDFWIVAIMSLFGALLGLLPSVVTGVVFNSIIPSAERAQLVQMATILVLCALSIAMFEFTRAIALLRIEGKMGNTVQSAIWDRLLSLPTSFFRPFTAGELAARAMSIDSIRQIISGSTVTALVSGVFSLANLGLMFYYASDLAWWATLLIAISLVVSMLGSGMQLSSQRKQYILQAKLSGTILQLLSNVGKLRVANAEIRAFASWAKGFATQRRMQYRTRTVGNAVATFNSAFPVVANMVIFWFALKLIENHGTLRTGDFLAFMSAFVACLTNAIMASTALLVSFNVIPVYDQARPILEARPEVTEGKREPGALTGAIDISHASFRYSADGPTVLRDVSISIQPGEFVAFVGQSGSGKSTLLRVLLSFEQLESGAVYFDGQDLDGLDIQSVRRQMGVVLQNGRIMSGDIYTNIVGSSLSTRDDAWEAARMAGFDDDIRAMPMGMNTMLSEGAGTLSGGQRQRLLIARAIVHRPRILLFDEATSALDNRTQAIVSRSLEQLQATRIVVAHRLSTILKADRIYVIDKGTVVESGRYEELMQRDGVFSALARRQLA